MPVRSPDPGDILTRIEQYVRQGDWDAAAATCELFASIRLPMTGDSILEHSRRLEKLLVAARIGRAGLHVSLSRVRAAARFTR